jgi:hypothetical protein
MYPYFEKIRARGRLSRFLGMAGYRKEWSFWFLVCAQHEWVVIRLEVMRVRVNGNGFGDRFKVKTLFTPRFLPLAIKSVGGTKRGKRM